MEQSETNNYDDEFLKKIEKEAIPENDFLEKSLISEIKQTINRLEQKCEGKMCQSVVEDRCRQLSYARILVDVYKKPIYLLVEPSAKLGEAYYDIKYYEQAKEHLLNALTYNNDPSNTETEILSKDYWLRLTIKLSKCHLETQLYEDGLKLAERTLLENRSLYGENDITEAEIYEIMYKCEKKLENYLKAIEYLKILSNLYEKMYSNVSEQCAFIYNEIGDIYKIIEKFPEAIENYIKCYQIREELVKENNRIEDLFSLSIKLGELYSNQKEYQKAYEILKKTDDDYNNGFNRSLKDRVIYQRLICTVSSFFEDNSYYLNELLKLEEILQDCTENKKTLAKTCLQIGHIYKKRKELEKSLEYFKKAKEIFVQHNDFKLITDVQKVIQKVTDEFEEMQK
jgi:tetratricopeptide (TPR) repeat protein